MWWEKWIPKSYLTKSSVCAVECRFEETGLVFHYALLQNRKGKIDVSKHGRVAEPSEILSIAAKASAPVCLILTGKGIMVRKIAWSENDNVEPSVLVQHYLPAIPLSEFYVQLYRNDGNVGYLALCRKEQLNQLMARFLGKKVELADVFIGELVCHALAPLTASYNRLTTPVTRLELVNGYVEDISPLGDTALVSLEADGFSVSPELLLLFAAGFSYFTRQELYTTSNTELSDMAQQHGEKIRVRLLLFVFIAVLFLVSGINSVLFFQKFEENNTLDVELNLYESKNSQITKLLDEYQKKKSLIEQAGIFDHKRISVYADKIAASLPQDIVLREMYFNPEDGQTEQDSLADFRENELIIKGNCSKSLLLNDWVNVLKSQSFVKQVNLENYVFSSDGHLPNFVLKLKTD